MKKFLAVALCGLLVVGCATTGPRHVATTGGLVSGSILDVIQDTEMQVVCGRVNAPQPPVCIDTALHHEISLRLADAYGLHRDLMLIIKDVPADQQPPDVQALLAKISKLISDIVALIPDGSKQKTTLVKQLQK